VRAQLASTALLKNCGQRAPAMTKDQDLVSNKPRDRNNETSTDLTRL
jgi:hypothetical protein